MELRGGRQSTCRYVNEAPGRLGHRLRRRKVKNELKRADSAIFLEFLPGSHAYLLTVLSVFWALAQLFATLVAWPLLGTLTCAADAVTCSRSDNMGWRYFVITMGGVALIMFLIRFVAFSIFESPKFHMGKGRDEMAVKIVHEVARRNGKTSGLSIEDLRSCDALQGEGQGMETDNAAAIKRKLASLKGDHVRALFATKRLAFSTAAIMVVWAFIGLAFPLYVSPLDQPKANHRMLSFQVSSSLEDRSTETGQHISPTETLVSSLSLVFQGLCLVVCSWSSSISVEKEHCQLRPS